jgi:hypothetical protein
MHDRRSVYVETEEAILCCLLSLASEAMTEEYGAMMEWWLAEGNRTNSERMFLECFLFHRSLNQSPAAGRLGVPAWGVARPTHIIRDRWDAILMWHYCPAWSQWRVATRLSNLVGDCHPITSVPADALMLRETPCTIILFYETRVFRSVASESLDSGEGWPVAGWTLPVADLTEGENCNKALPRGLRGVGPVMDGLATEPRVGSFEKLNLPEYKCSHLPSVLQPQLDVQCTPCSVEARGSTKASASHVDACNSPVLKLK